MGLGPVVCTDCKVYADLDDNGHWVCPVCNSDFLGHIWEQKDEEIFEQNTKFVNFVRGDK